MTAINREVVRLPHHEQRELCVTRAKYRQGKKLTAVKASLGSVWRRITELKYLFYEHPLENEVYTVNDESQHLLVCGVPSLGLQDDVRRVCSKFGDIKSLVFVPKYADEEFTDAFHLQYCRIQSARYAKHALDGREFFGGILHVCYMPEMESLLETRAKLIQRRKDVAKRTRGGALESNTKTGCDDDMVHYKPRKHSLSQNNMNCIWQGIPCSTDPRTIRPHQDLIQASTVYGPHMPDKEYWAQAGVRERKFISDRHFHKKPTTGLLTNQQLTSTKQPASVLRFIPRQVAGAKRIVFRNKTEDKTEADTEKNMPEEKTENNIPEGKTDSRKRKAESSLEETAKDIRAKIRAVSVPNVQIVLDRGDPINR